MENWPKWEKRPVQTLDGTWDCAYLGELDTPEEFDGDLHGITTEKMIVPGVFDTMPTFVRKRGTFLLRRRVAVKCPERDALLKFGGTGLWSQVRVDGDVVATNRTPYAPWQVVVPSNGKAEREVVLLIDNRFDERRVPLFYPCFDFFAYGGIYRSIGWQELPEVALDRASVIPLDLEGRVRIDLRMVKPFDGNLDSHFSFDGGEVVMYALSFDAGVASVELQVPSPRIWSPEDPALHTLSVTLAGETLKERFGIRVIEARGREIVVNGEALKLIGFNRHEAHAQFGPALPQQQMLQDIQWMKKMGCNFVRGSHYPQDQCFLDLCDETGILVWEEALGWQALPEQFKSEDFRKLQMEQTRAMVQTSINHPSIVMWGFLNECSSDQEESDLLVPDLARLVRSSDSSRLVTFASNHPFEERHYAELDVISINQYPGWYPEDWDKERPLDEIEPLIDRLLAHLKAEGQQEKPFIISEMGAGAIYGWRDELEAHWSEQYQAQFLNILCQRVVEDRRIAGLAIWQFCDCRTYADGHALGRPRAFNNKGVLDEYRRPKMAAAVVERVFQAFRQKSMD
jgi:beta-glucuronidase